MRGEAMTEPAPDWVLFDFGGVADFGRELDALVVGGADA
jgi:hypothetical protein